MMRPPPAGLNIAAPLAVAIGPYHHDKKQVQAMEEAKRATLEEFCRVAEKSPEEVQDKIISVAASARECYHADETTMFRQSGDDRFARMMLLDGCFLLQLLVSMTTCPRSPRDPLMSRVDVYTRIDGIVRDVMLLENQIPWLVLEALAELRPDLDLDALADKFVALMASAFDANEAPGPGVGGGHQQRPPDHLLGLFHRRQMGMARTQSTRVPRLSSLSNTAVELAEMGVKLEASKTTKVFGDMAMVKRQWKWRGRLGLFGELSLAPVVLNDLTACWLVNMAAYEVCLGATLADNFAVNSYLSMVALLVNREEDVQELRAKGIINSALSNMATLEFFKWAAPHLRLGHRYSMVYRGIQEYRQERWVWIAIHRFWYQNYRTIAAVLSTVGVLAGLFKTILSLKQPQQ